MCVYAFFGDGLKKGKSEQSKNLLVNTKDWEVSKELVTLAVNVLHHWLYTSNMFILNFTDLALRNDR